MKAITVAAWAILGSGAACSGPQTPRELETEMSTGAPDGAAPAPVDADATDSGPPAPTRLPIEGAGGSPASPDAGRSTPPSGDGATNLAPETPTGEPDPSTPPGVPINEPHDAGVPLPPEPIGSRNFACAPSPSPMFQGSALLEMRLYADFSVVNGAPDKEGATSPGWLDPDGPGPLPPVAVKVQARGVSRFQHCGFRPFKVRFSEKQKDNVFQTLGKTVKFSTHCGTKEGMAEIFEAASLDEYYQRVRMEHLVYQLLAPLETMSLETRLVSLTYEDTSTGAEETHLAFVREPEDELGQRCGMLEGEDIPETPTTLNQRAHLLLYLLNNFVIQADASKNRFELVDEARGLRASVPYDFDLVGIFRREYLGLHGRSLSQNAEAFADWLRRNQSAALHEEAQWLLSKADVMRQRVAAAELSGENRALFEEWLEYFLGVLESFQMCRGREQDPNLPACYVPDEHGDSLDVATPSTLGEHSLLIEPPGDRDVVQLSLEPGRLYTVTSSVSGVIRSPGQEILGVVGGASDEAALSLRLGAQQGGAYTLELDRGDALVCSDMWSNQPETLVEGFAVYEDDHAGNLALATPLESGTTTTGRWELAATSGLFDEDWFTVSIAANERLLFSSEGEGFGRVDVHAMDEQVEVGSYDVFGPVDREDISYIFPGPGSYVVRVIQALGHASFALEVGLDAE